LMAENYSSGPHLPPNFNTSGCMSLDNKKPTKPDNLRVFSLLCILVDAKESIEQLSVGL